MDAVTMIREDHRAVEQLFKKYEGLSERAHKTKRQTVDKILHLLAIHAAIEEEILYPVAREVIEGVDDTVLEALEEHLVMKWELASLEDMSPDDERFDAKVKVLIEVTRHHVKEEERDLLPQLRQVMSRAELRELGDALAAAKRTAPTHPHPRLADTPPAVAVAGLAAGIVDRARDVGKETVDQVRARIG
jgi:hemerythrin-like domain-containing protein